MTVTQAFLREVWTRRHELRTELKNNYRKTSTKMKRPELWLEQVRDMDRALEYGMVWRIKTGRNWKHI